MPKIIVNEIDQTKAGFDSYSNYAVAIPGFRSVFYDDDNPELADEKTPKYSEIFDENGIFECTSPSAFEKYIGKVAPISIAETEIVVNEETGATEKIAIEKHYGNQMAYELLKLGYKVLFLDLGYIDQAVAADNIMDFEIKTLDSDLAKLETADFWEALKDKANYDFRFITHGLLDGKYLVGANKAIYGVADGATSDSQEESSDPLTLPGRGDCIALIEADESKYVGGKTPAETIDKMAKAIRDCGAAGAYGAITVPSLCYYGMSDAVYQNNHFPAAMHYLACFMNMLKNGYSEWYAAAGYEKGVSSLSIESTQVKLGEAAIAALEPRTNQNNKGLTAAVNVIANFRGNYYLWGNRTAMTLGTELRASHFLNIRQLCSTIKKQVYTSCRRFTFDPNSDVLWVNFCRSIEPTLDAMKADQGIIDYKIEKVPTAKKATLAARIRIIPIEAVEDFEIALTLEDSFSDIAVTFNEN